MRDKQTNRYKNITSPKKRDDDEDDDDGDDDGGGDGGEGSDGDSGDETVLPAIVCDKRSAVAALWWDQESD